MLKTFEDVLTILSSLPFVAKLLISAAILLLAGAILVIIWRWQAKNSAVAPTVSRAMWPQERSFEGLKRTIDRTSKTDRQILLAVVDSGRDGLNVSGPDSLEEKFSLSRNDLLYRGQHLQSLQLIEIVSLPDTNYRLDEDVWNLFGLDGTGVLRTLLT